MEKYYNDELEKEMVHIQQLMEGSSLLKKIVWTDAMKHLFCVVGCCLRYSEPFLLVGETGTGKDDMSVVCTD